MTWFRCGMKNNEYKVLDSIVDHTITSFKANYTIIKSQLFSSCTLLTDVNIPEATTIGTFAFSGCSGIKFLDLPKVNSILSNSFNGCTGLETLILRSETMCVLQTTSGLSGTKFYTATGSGGKLYVPQALITSYQNNTVWSDLLSLNANNQILAIEGSPYEEV